jgi:membrane fusion protein
MRSQDRLHGEVSLVPPVSWQLFGIFLFASIAVSGLFLSLASYGKSTVVQGEIQGDRGLSRAVPQRAGLVDDVLVREGQRVRRGQPLARISVSTTEGGASLEERRLAALGRKAAAVRGRSADLAVDTRARIASLQAQIAGWQAELASLGDQIRQERDMVTGAEQDLAKIQDIARRGFISGNDIRLREDKASQRRQDLARLGQDEATRRSQIAVARADMEKARSELAIQMRDVENDRADIDRAAADDQNARSVVVVAGADGIVTGITAHRGDPADTSRPLMAVVPDGSRLQAVLDVPASTSGFLERGQEIRVAVDAYPYQTYGTISARVGSISDATVPVTDESGRPAQAFLVRADLRDAAVRAYGRPQALRPGMTVSARIVTRRRSLLGLLFDPLYAIGRR